MEGQSSSGNSQHQYQSEQWSRFIRRSTLADTTSDLPSSTTPLDPHDLVPILARQQPSFHQAQLSHYNRLITSSRVYANPSSPLPPLLSPEHIQAVPGSRSRSSSGNRARNHKSSFRGGHGNQEARKFSQGERAPVTEKPDSLKMSDKKMELSGQLPLRPLPHHQTSNLSHQSNSVPSTPHQHARKFSFESREPSPTAPINHSPRSAYSESNVTLPSSRPPIPPFRTGCRFETAMAHTRRRIPYSIGSERLEKLSPASVKSKLTKDEEEKLTTDMRELYGRLLPSPESEGKRKKLLEKLENMFNAQWPGHDIRVHVFGSSGNLLYTDESDVDICITTKWKALEDVCKIAELLAKNGMTKVICVSTAKVPIVKVFDPELGLACDMNVNNTLALENTRMMKTYVEIDPRVRPLAMIIKHWTRRRIVNDAAFGGTLSSYTWICMIVNFLQTLNKPILPSLHQRPHWKVAKNDGTESAFADDISRLRGFGAKNDETIGSLLFRFFRFYGHDFDYDKLVISVRSGRQITKVEKGWHITNNNALCVEEPFNPSRNLSNTADDTSFRGLHIEIRRAFALISAAKLEECCEEYVYPKEEKPTPGLLPAKKETKALIVRSASQSNQYSGRGRGGHRGGGRQSHRHNGNNNNNRRSSSAAFESNPGHIPPLSQNLTHQETWLQAQAQAQLHNDLYQTYSVLQAQENTLRMQLYNQSQAYIQLQNPNQAFNQPPNRSRVNSTASQQAADRNRTNLFDQAPLTAPIRPEMYYFPLAVQNYGSSMYPHTSSNTNPSSPALNPAVPELRRSMHRSSVANGSGVHSSSSLRSHSQPAARSAPSGGGIPNPGLGVYSQYPHHHVVPNFLADENHESGTEAPGESSTGVDSMIPKDYLGYYVQPLVADPRRRDSILRTIPAFGDLHSQQGGRRASAISKFPQSFHERVSAPSRSPSPLGHDRTSSVGASSVPMSAVPSQQSHAFSNGRSFSSQVPLVVNGSSGVSIPTWRRKSDDDDHSSDAPVGSVESSTQFSMESDFSRNEEFSGQVTPKHSRDEERIEAPKVVNGSTSALSDSLSSYKGPIIANGASTHHLAKPNGTGHNLMNDAPRLSPTSRNRLARQVQNGGMSPLDIGLVQGDYIREDLPHLSPVYETRTPSPSASRKFEPGMERKLKESSGKDQEGKFESYSSKLGPGNANQIKQTLGEPKPNGHTRNAKSEGSPGGWQKITKGKKKGTSSEFKTLPNGYVLSEKHSKKDSERKGG